MKLKLALASVLLTLGLAAPASAQYSYPAWQSSWQLIGTRDVRHRAEYDTIFAHGYDRYRQVKLCVYQRPVRLYDLDVVFHNGGHQDLNVRHVLNPGECTRAIDLYGNRRNIKFVTMAYETIGRHFGRRAVVQVYAR
ncbi:MAG: hypothetical protein K8S25_11860 [Alphaproteobacteria bacterium]|nr:hypothetical protein [Alphaproteobacteria bacterium]